MNGLWRCERVVTRPSKGGVTVNDIRVLVTIATAALVTWGQPVFAQSPPVVEYYHLDAVGSIRAVTDQAGATVRRHDYFAFGEEYLAQSALDPWRFAAKERDAETGLDYFSARYYTSRAGRFTTVDPDHVGGDLFDPQSWNAYAYARNNPIRFVDPTGTDYFVNVDSGQAFWVSDREFDTLSANPGAGISLLGGLVVAGGRIVGTYQYYAPFDRVLVEAGRRAEPGVNLAIGVGIAQVGVVASVATASAVTGSTLTTLAIGSAPLLPAVQGAVVKLQRIGLSLRQAAEIVANPGSQRFIDKANGNTINVIAQVGDKLVRITLDPSGQRIISAGYVQARNIANSVASGRFIPQ